MENEQKGSIWNVPLNIIRTYGILITFMGIMAFCIYGIPYIINNTETGKEIYNSIQQAQDLKEKQYDIVRNSKDCFVLKETILDLISEGDNDKSWFPNGSDTDLRIAKERFDYLGCKN